MNAGEPPDEEGDDAVEDSSTDPGGDTANDEGTAPDDGAAGGDADDGTDGTDERTDDAAPLDPAQEVEAAVEDVMGPGVLDDGEPDERESDVAETVQSETDEAEVDEAEADAAEADAAEADPGEGDEGEDEPLSSDGEADEVADAETTASSLDADDVDETDGDVDDVNGDIAEADDGTSDEDDDGVASGDETDDGVASGDETEDAPVSGEGESFRRDEPLSVEEDQAEDDGVDESAAVRAAQELVDAERDGETADGQGTDAGADGDGTAEGDVADEPPDEEDADAAADEAGGNQGVDGVEETAEDVPADVRKYDRFKKIDGGTYDRANEFLRDRTYITAREWAMARLCADFRTETGVEMTKIGENLPELVPFMTDTYTPQAVNQARAAFEEKVRKAGATFLYGAMCDFFTAEELDDVMYEATEVAKFLLEVEGVELSVEEELAAEDHISEVMRDVREHSAALRHDEVTCPECGHEIGADD